MYEKGLEVLSSCPYVYAVPYTYETMERQMKASALVLTAALIALPGAAFAGDDAVLPKHPAHGKHAIHKVEKKADLDYGKTGSIAKPDQQGKNDAQKDGKRLGIDVSPWMMPVIH